MAKGTAYTDLTVFSPEGDEFELNVEFKWWDDPGVRYHADGSGTPPDSGMDWVRYTSATAEPIPDWVTDDLVNEAFDKAEIELPAANYYDGSDDW